ncbi:MAG: hypothetical protein WD875_07640 [Pirellulales bacterium]
MALDLHEVRSARGQTALYGRVGQMITIARSVRSVAEVMEDNEVGFDELVERTEIDERIVQAIVHQWYTPRPDQRDRVCAVLGVRRSQVMWGHAIVPEPHIHAPV